MVIMVLNSGSSSIKFQIIETENTGIGENEPTVRSRVCRGLEIIGIELDEEKNPQNEELISTSDSKVKVLVIPTDEEQLIASETKRIVESLGESS